MVSIWKANAQIDTVWTKVWLNRRCSKDFLGSLDVFYLLWFLLLLGDSKQRNNKIEPRQPSRVGTNLPWSLNSYILDCKPCSNTLFEVNWTIRLEFSVNIRTFWTIALSFQRGARVKLSTEPRAFVWYCYFRFVFYN